ncbi:heme-binding protein [Mesorhizobium sp. B2-4-15]|uniref:GlcG/HbpS family heme-binding protein n=1 Tax=Mesorhizobium sp. B2-4-15 TaxID=2589934 RepID=UPI0011541D9A|nr:heme-binding protein [Mesorhizobium sp. B2-4-15]TPK62404.1 heme-binding protein [Mesorhizobium sp. B2-4-15]
MLTIPTLGHTDAAKAVKAIGDAIAAEGKNAVIAVADQQGELIALSRLDGAPYPSILIAANKAWTAARERTPSMHIGQAARAIGRGFDMGSYGDARYTGFGGGIPVILDGRVLGAVAVSGLSTDEDIEFAQKGVDAILRR